MLVEVLVALLCVLVVAGWLAWRRRQQRTHLLLVGLCGAGKTALFGQLCQGRFLDTFTSLKENVGVVKASSVPEIPVVDIPGHERLRGHMLETFSNQARAVIFVVDSVTFNAAEVAQFAFDVLTQPGWQHVPLLFLCNKEDVTVLAQRPQYIQEQLEQALNTVRTTRRGTLEATDGTQFTRTLADENVPFRFAQLGSRVSFMGFSCLGRLQPGTGERKVNREPLLQWLAEQWGK
eukprot:m.127171 g.127171  ORF g.127171 m.127171 type:complete len:234 (+) comp19845_c0_seq3:1550-2251(+)